MDFSIPKEILDEMYNNQLDLINNTHNVPLKVEYQTGGTFDSFLQTWTVQPTLVTKNIFCSYREDTRVGEVVSSEIISGFPTGDVKVFIPYSSAIDTDTIKPVTGSLKFTLRPTSTHPVELIPKDVGMSYEYLLDNEIYPLTQRFLCRIKDFK